MTVTNQTLDIYSGDSAIVYVSLVDEDGAPFDASSATAIRYRVATSAHAEASLIAKDDGSGISMSEGGIDITLDASDTASLHPAVYYHELKLYGTALGDVITALTGSFIVRPALNMGSQHQALLYLVGGSDMSGDLTTP